MSHHIVLLGDSIFDNAAYVPGGPSVIEHVRERLPQADAATLLALNGSTVASVLRQLERIPEEATHLVLSAGGNDARWMASNVFTQPSSDIQSALEQLAQALTEFEHQYRYLVSELCSLRCHLTVCTIYDSIPGLDASKTAGLCLFNDTISRTAIENRATLIDLRTICNEATDYSTISPIEPSASGGGKIARAIVESVYEGEKFHRVIG